MKNLTKAFFGLCLTTAFFTSCSEQKPQPALTKSGLDPQNFAKEVRGKQTQLFTITNANGMEVCITNFGGRVVSIMAPDRNGEFQDVVLGFDSVADYVNKPSDFGASIGRYANRINKGRIVIDGDSIQLPVNNYGHCLHGGPEGWQYQVYDGEKVNDSTIVMKMHSPDGDANFPGNLDAVVTYTLKSDNSLDIAYEATTDKKTVVNMTNHTYFNLSGDPSQPATDHILYVNADSYTPVDSTFMTTGEIAPVAQTPMDFRVPKAVGQDVDKRDFDQIKNGNGYDHNWVLNTKGDITKPAAKLTSPKSGISVEVYTDEPGIQVYSGNFLDGTLSGKKGIQYNQRASVCLETQHFPDSPNKPEWPSTILEPGQTYKSHCIYKFTAE